MLRKDLKRSTRVKTFIRGHDILRWTQYTLKTEVLKIALLKCKKKLALQVLKKCQFSTCKCWYRYTMKSASLALRGASIALCEIKGKSIYIGIY